MKSETNIWHVLAEQALLGAYDIHSSVAISHESSILPFEYFIYFMGCKDYDEQFYELETEEQCLFLLFIGEMYEDE